MISSILSLFKQNTTWHIPEAYITSVPGYVTVCRVRVEPQQCYVGLQKYDDTHKQLINQHSRYCTAETFDTTNTTYKAYVAPHSEEPRNFSHLSPRLWYSL